MAFVQDTIQNEAGEDITINIEVADQSIEDTNLYSNTRGPSQLAQDSFKKATELIHTCAESIAQSIHRIPDAVKPKEFEVQFAVKIDMAVGAVIAKSSTEAQIQVTLKWGEKDS